MTIPAGTEGSVPAVSIIIPTYNRADVLRLCLDRLAAQTVPPGDMEIIVADDGSTDGTGDMVAAWSAATNDASIEPVYFRQENAGANAARNAAIRVARAPLLLIINDDTLAVPGLVAAHLALHRAHPEPPVCVLGRMTISPDLPHSLFAALHHDAAFEQFEGRAELGWDAFFTCNLSVKRRFLLDHGLFDENLRWHEDIELGERLVPHGMRLLYCPVALGLHHHALTEAAYLRIAAREGQALASWHRKQEKSGQPSNATIAAVLHPALRHRAADAVLRGPVLRLALSVARKLAAARPKLARMIYARVFQRIKRETFWRAISAR